MASLIDRFDIEKVAKLMEADDYSSCRQFVEKLSSRVDHTSSWLLYIKGICEDNLGNPFNALINFKKALQMDQYNHSFLIAITTNVGIFKNILLRALDDQGIDLTELQKIHRVLKEAGELTSTCQYLLAKNYLVRKNIPAADELISNFLSNNPKDADALILEKLIHERGKRIAS
jgi:tetratricopeptide (TPR) repeat protein